MLDKFHNVFTLVVLNSKQNFRHPNLILPSVINRYLFIIDLLTMFFVKTVKPTKTISSRKKDLNKGLWNTGSQQNLRTMLGGYAGANIDAKSNHKSGSMLDKVTIAIPLMLIVAIHLGFSW